MTFTDYDVDPLVHLRYYNPVVQWSNGEWYYGWPSRLGHPVGSVSSKVEQFIRQGYVRTEIDRGYRCARLTNKGHVFLDETQTTYSLPPGLHMLPDERLYSQPKAGAKGRPRLHEEFLVMTGGVRLVNAISQGEEVYIGTVPPVVKPGDVILLSYLGELYSARPVVVTRTYGDQNGQHACVIKPPQGVSAVYEGSVLDKPWVISPVGIWHQDVKPIVDEVYRGITAQLGWTGQAWQIDVWHPRKSGTNMAHQVIQPTQLELALSQVCRTPTKVHVSDGRLVIQGLAPSHAYRIYWLLRQMHVRCNTQEQGYSPGILDWTFDDPTATALHQPTYQEILQLRKQR